MKVAGSFVPGTKKAVAGIVVGFHTSPVGAAGVGFSGFFGSLCMHAVGGTIPPGSGSLTRSGVAGCGTPVPSYSVEQPVALSDIQNGLAAGVNATPHAFCSTGSVLGATPGISEVRLVCT